MKPSAHRPVVAIVGRPNVGKSKLFNRLLNQQRSIVADMPGVTRDRIYAEAQLNGADNVDVDVVLVDTGGFDPNSSDPIMRRVVEQTQLAIDEADAVIFLTDGRAGVMPEDHDISHMLRRGQKKVVLGVNKLDGPSQDDLLGDFYALGVKEMLPISGAHGRNIAELGEQIVAMLPPRSEDDVSAIEEAPEAGVDPSETSTPTRVAVIGRPNAGKSSLINRLLGEDRHLVSEVAGTTVDSVDSLVEWQGKPFLFIDTAGIRRKRSIAFRLERYSVIAALKGLERSDVALLILDATEPIAKQDAKVSAFAYERGKAVILVISKWDKIPGEVQRSRFSEALQRELPHLAYAPVVYTSAHTGLGMERLMPAVEKVHTEYCHRVPTSRLNRFVEKLMKKTPPTSHRGRHGKIYYITQIDVRPPRFLVSVNDPELFHFSYRRFIVNSLRDEYGFSGVPLLVGYRSHKDKSERADPRHHGIETDPKKRKTAMRRARKVGKTLPPPPPRKGRSPKTGGKTTKRAR